MAKKVSFEDQLNQLEDIREELESGDLSLDKAIKLYEQGTKVLQGCRDQLDKYEEKIEELAAFDDDEDDDDE